MTPEEIGAWPGKTFAMGAEHPALWHMLDVAACADRLIQRRGFTGREGHDGAAVLLIALHDLGKFSRSFRAALRDGAPQSLYHWQHSHRLLERLDEGLAERMGGSRRVRRILAAAVAGHHGGPPAPQDARQDRRQDTQIGSEGFEAAERALAAVLALPLDASLADITDAQAKALSWRLSGLTIQADWIGSNPEWFGPAPPGISISDYWRMALDRADVVVEAAGLERARPRIGGAARVLPHGRAPRPMQEAVASAALSEGPTLVLIEDATGAGKTEAALILAARMMEAGKGGGLFFALPTMATSDAMLPRLETVAGRLLEGRPSLALTHGRARQNGLFRTIRGRSGSAVEGEPSCGGWLADDRRRVLLAEMGVGTIDQALLAVLPTRFSTLRLEALSRRILIVDEAHAYDPYMEAELSRLLRFQAMLWGSAIVMTATLPLGMRDRLAAAFQEGLGVKPQALTTRHYPSLGIVARDVSTPPVAPVPATCRRLPIRRLDGDEEALDALVSARACGAACVWVRNAVDDAIAAAEALRERGLEANLLHACFAVCDRLEREAEQVARFGRDGAGRVGHVLVATQVVEQSLDLDFDVMVSDLAPIGSLIQRAGRLWRHMDLQPADSRPVPEPELMVLSPDPAAVEDARWLHRVLDRGAWVYPADVQWRTARAVFDAGVIDAPDGLRDLIEAVHGETARPVPEPLERAEIEGRKLRERQQARMSLIDPADGFAQPQLNAVWSDERFPTRLGEPQATLRLARRVDGALRPWGEDWASSEVQVSAARLAKAGGVDQESPEVEAAKRSWPRWMRELVHLAAVQEEGTIVPSLRYDVERGLVWGAS